LFEEQRLERAVEKLGFMGAGMPVMEPDNLLDWLVKRGICPHALVSINSKYHFENIALLDGEMSLSLPDQNVSIGQTPSIFFQALSIVRTEKFKVRQEESESK
jgi:hypothetical protein